VLGFRYRKQTGALAAFREGLAAIQRAVALAPDNANWQRDLAVIHRRIGELLRVGDDKLPSDPASALAALRKALAAIASAVARAPENGKWQRELALVHRDIGQVLEGEQDLAGALAAYHDELAAMQHAVARAPTDGEWQRELAFTLRRIGRVLGQQKDHAGAVAAYREGRAILQGAAALMPDDESCECQVASIDARIAWNLLVIEGENGALAALRDRHVALQRAAERAPGNADLQLMLSVNQGDIGALLKEVGDSVGALAAFREGRAAAQRAVALSPEDASHGCHVLAALDKDIQDLVRTMPAQTLAAVGGGEKDLAANRASLTCPFVPAEVLESQERAPGRTASTVGAQRRAGPKKTVTDYVPLIQAVVHSEFVRVEAQLAKHEEWFGSREYPKIVAKAKDNKIAAKAIDKVLSLSSDRQLTDSYVATFASWAIRTELANRYDWYCIDEIVAHSGAPVRIARLLRDRGRQFPPPGQPPASAGGGAAQEQLDPQLLEGKVARGFLGVVVTELTPDFVQGFGLEEGTRGALVQSVQAKSPASKAGIQPGDVVVSVNGKPVENGEQLILSVSSVPPGGEVTVTVLRGNERKDVHATVAQRPEEEALARGGETPQEEALETPQEEGEGEQGAKKPGEEKLGVRVAPLTPQIARELGIGSEQGVLVGAVSPGGPVATAGIRRNDVILEVNRQPLKSVDQLLNAIGKMKPGQVVVLRVQRGQQAALFVAVKLGGEKK
jgi:hypothetical protein